MSSKKGLLLNIFFKLCVFAAAVSLLCVFDSYALTLGQRLVYLSVRTLLPKNGIVVFKEKEPEKEFRQAISATEKSESVIENEAVIVEQQDADIKNLVSKALKTSTEDKKGGEIYEYTFTTDGVTDAFGNVKVKNVNETQIDIEGLLNEKADLTVEKDKPTVLIYHTHTTETYQLLDRSFYAANFNARTNDKTQNMVRVGQAICSEIEKAGFEVIHDTEIYDNPYSGAYYRSEDKVKAYLEKYPSIDITLDIHRDAIESDGGVKTKPTAVIGGKKAAQLMIISGCQEEGNGITDLPDWEQNLVFALQLQNIAETMFPGLMRPLYFCPRSYNMSLTHCSLLIEMGSDANTLSEAVYSGRLLGKAIAQMLKEYSDA